jgi:hypothetical protein
MPARRDCTANDRCAPKLDAGFTARRTSEMGRVLSLVARTGRSHDDGKVRPISSRSPDSVRVPRKPKRNQLRTRNRQRAARKRPSTTLQLDAQTSIPTLIAAPSLNWFLTRLAFTRNAPNVFTWIARLHQLGPNEQELPEGAL